MTAPTQRDLQTVREFFLFLDGLMDRANAKVIQNQMYEQSRRLVEKIEDYAGPNGPKLENVRAAWRRVIESLEAESRKAIDDAETEIERPPTWTELMSILDTHYPADIFDGSSGDMGPRLVRLARVIDEQTAEIAKLEGGQSEGGKA